MSWGSGPCHSVGGCYVNLPVAASPGRGCRSTLSCRNNGPQLRRNRQYTDREARRRRAGIGERIESPANVRIEDALHLAVSMRSFRAEHVSHLVKQLLDLELDARNTLNNLQSKYPIVITRDLTMAKRWLRSKARGSERYGILVSSQAERLN